MIGIILLNWNGIDDTVECVESLLNSKTNSLHIYVVDNNSGNNEGAIIAAKFPGIQVLQQENNLGFCEGNNVGISKAIADGMHYVMMLNNDTLVPPGFAEPLIADFNNLSAAGAISPVILEYPEKHKVWFAKAGWDSGRAQFSLNPENKEYNSLQHKEPWLSEFACGCCLLTSAKVIQEVGLLDGRYFAYYDEAEWCKRLEKNGYLSYVTGHSAIYHKVSRTTPGLVSTYLLARNRLLWMKENLTVGQRLKSFLYLKKEFFWHLFNSRGIVKGEYSKAHSRAYIQGWKDYRKGKFGKWDSDTEKIIFQKNQ